MRKNPDNRIASKFEVALAGYVPREWISCLAYQQARVQEHALIEKASQSPREKHCDIRSLFGGKNGGKASESPTGVKQKYQQGITKLFTELQKCDKEERLPRFLPIFGEDVKKKCVKRREIMSRVSGDASSLMNRCRISLLRFVPSEGMENIVEFVAETISENTPKDGSRSEFIQKIHRCVDKCIDTEQPFLVKRE